jgi:DNA-binding transcriptional MerR regulator
VATKKLYYKIGEACKKLDIQPYVLRYWETEFTALSPDKSKSGQRVYSDRDLEVIGRIKELLYEEGFTIAGAKKKLEGELKSGKPLTGTHEEPDEPAAETEPPAKPAKSKKVADPEVMIDPATAKELAQVRKGVEKALKETEAILALLDSGPKRS